MLSTSCSELCAQVAGTTAACVNLQQTALRTCQATQQIGNVVTCAADTAAGNRTALCIAPLDTHTWSFLLTDDIELLALARSSTAASASEDAVVLDAANVDSIQNVAITSAVWSLALTTDRSPPTLKLDADTLTKWTNLETLYVRAVKLAEGDRVLIGMWNRALENVDLSQVTTLPEFPELTILCVCCCCCCGVPYWLRVGD